jgi:hypothetical protein
MKKQGQELHELGEKEKTKQREKIKEYEIDDNEKKRENKKDQGKENMKLTKGLPRPIRVRGRGSPQMPMIPLI